MAKNPLGKNTAYPDKYAPDVLFPIPRWPSRSLLDIDKKISMYGFDFWHAYELSWLDKSGRPQAAIAELYFDARSENIVESKSLKLYLHSLGNETFSSQKQIAKIIARDLQGITHSEVKVLIREMEDEQLLHLQKPFGHCIDQQEVTISQHSPDPGLLQVEEKEVDAEQLYSHVFKSNCPITGQPDWATVLIEYSGRKINEAALLAYLCSFRSHMAYHEECAEMLFRDIMLRCKPGFLLLGMNYTRRGGIDINPFRSNVPVGPDLLSFRFVRQ